MYSNLIFKQKKEKKNHNILNFARFTDCLNINAMQNCNPLLSNSTSLECPKKLQLDQLANLFSLNGVCQLN